MARNGKTKAHILVVPFPQSGHMLPLIDLTHQLALRHVTVTVVVTPKNHHYLQPLLHHHSSENLVKPLVIPFPSHPSIPDGAENMSQLPVDAISHMMDAFSQLYHPLADWLTNNPPDDSPQAILADMFSIPWTNKLASAFGLKSIAFLPTAAHTLSVIWGQDDRGFLEEMIQCTRKCWALLFNSFRDLEPDYVLEDLKTNFMNHPRVLPVGPIIPVDTGADRGGKSSVPIDHLTSWLDSCPENSVVYVGFGSQISMTGPQKEAIAAALEKSKVRFIWAMRKTGGGDAEGDDETALPEGFEDRTAGKGMVIRGWAPQKVILEHKAVGSNLTHLGWGSVMEGILGGTLLLAWPMHADNHFNVKLLVDEMGVAVKVCDGMQGVPDSDKLASVFAEAVKDDSPHRAKLLKIRDLGLRAITDGGSSAAALDALITEIAN